MAKDKDEKFFRENFIFLNHYCTSVASEHKPRGPKGPYQFTDKTVPCTVIKRWDGKTLIQKRGFFVNDKGRKTRTELLKGWLKVAKKGRGKFVETDKEKIKPLLTSYDKAMKLVKDKPVEAYNEFESLVKKGNDKEEFKAGVPHVAKVAREMKKNIIADAKEKVEKAALYKDEGEELKKLKKKYEGIDEITDLLDETIKNPPKATDEPEKEDEAEEF